MMTERSSVLDPFARRLAAPTAAVLVLLVTVSDAVDATSRLHDTRTPTVTEKPAAQQPRVGEVRWSGDGLSLLRWSGRGWVITGWTRTFPSRERRVYDLFVNLAPMARIDEREPGWTLATDYAGAFKGVPRKWPSNNPQAVHYLMNRQWMTTEQYLAYLVSLLQRLIYLEQHPQPTPPRAPGTLKPGEIAPNVRENLPMNAAYMTREEVEYVRKSNMTVIGMMQRSGQRSSCELNQSSYAYNTATGALIPGWYDTPNGPMRKGC
jgi:hypothetical protein